MSELTPRQAMRVLAEMESLHREVGKGLEMMRSGYLGGTPYAKLVEIAEKLARGLGAFAQEWDEE